jgi:UDP-N-acetylmuramate--alanine ligase
MNRVHLIGIGGSGMSAIARVLLESGFRVSGSDRQRSPLTEQLREAGAQVFIGHRPENVAGADLVVRSSAIPDDNVEVQAARSDGIPVLKRAEFLGKLMEGKLGIAVAGTHGKTTTTAMISWVLSALDQDPSYIIGSTAKNLNTNAHAGSGAAFVIEADEYDLMFLGLRPTIAVVTNIEHDHPDCFPTAEEFKQAFVAFAARLVPGGTLIACTDDPGASELLRMAATSGFKTRAYGLNLRPDGVAPDYLGKNLRINNMGCFSFETDYGETKSVTVSLKVPGEHNVRNALGTLAVVNEIGLSIAGAARALDDFEGAGRRFDIRGVAKGITVIDDYAHHPTEIRATLAAARARYPDRGIWAVWQPHTYSRTLALYHDFLGAFDNADHVLILEVYAAREQVRSDFSARQLVQDLENPEAIFVPDLDQAQQYLLKHMRPGEVVLVLSAGDANQLSGTLLVKLSRVEEG